MLANEFSISVSSIRVSSILKCHECTICGGQYYGRLNNDRCAICSEMFDENKRMVTRSDGVVFMVSNSKNYKTIKRYVVTKLGNLKLIGTPKHISKRPLSTVAEDLAIDEGEGDVTESQVSAVSEFDDEQSE